MKFKWGENTAFRLLALFLAFVLWIYVSHQRNPVMEQVARISLEQQGLPANMIIQDMPSAVNVYYRSSRGRLALVSPGAFTAHVNLDGVEAGTHSMPVQVGAPDGVEVVRISPQTVTVSLDSIEEKNIPVAVNVLGAPGPGYKRLDPVVTPAVVKAVGPSQLLNEITNVAVTLDIRGTNTGIERVLPVSTGVEGVELQPESVRVTVPVEALPARTVSIIPRVTGSPAEGFRVEGHNVEPGAVQISGDQQSLAGIEGLQTAPVDISGANSNVTATIKVVTPERVSSVKPAQVRVTVVIVPEEANVPDEGEENPGEPEPEE